MRPRDITLKQRSLSNRVRSVRPSVILLHVRDKALTLGSIRLVGINKDLPSTDIPYMCLSEVYLLNIHYAHCSKGQAKKKNELRLSRNVLTGAR